MKTPSIFLIILIRFLLHLVTAIQQWEMDIQSDCQEFGIDTFTVFEKSRKIPWSLYDAFDPQQIIDKGSFGFVYKVNFPFQLLSSQTYGYSDPGNSRQAYQLFAAVKRVDYKESAAKEITAMRILTSKRIGTAYFGCQYSKKYKTVYIVQEYLDGVLTDPNVRLIFAQESPLKRIRHFQYLFQQVIALYESGYINNDIKLGNMMYDKKKDRIKIIDLGMAQEINTALFYCGSKYYFTPGKCRVHNLGKKGLRASLIEDLYPLALSLAAISNKNGFWGLFTHPITRKEMTHCLDQDQELLAKNLRIRVLDSFPESEYGKPEIATNLRFFAPAKSYDGSKWTNFKGLIDLIMTYDYFDMSPGDVLKIVQNEVDRIRKEAENAETKEKEKESDLTMADYLNDAPTKSKAPILKLRLKEKSIETSEKEFCPKCQIFI